MQPRTERDKLIEIVEANKTRLYHEPDRTAFAEIEVKNDDLRHRENHPLRSRQFELYLGNLYWNENRRVVSKSVIEDTIGLLEGQAIFEGPEIEVYRRVAFFDGRVYVDLCDRDWRVVEISVDGWKVLMESPVRFIRSKNAQPLPEPKPGGSVEMLRRCINAGDDTDFILMVSWLLSTLQPYGAYPILILQGEQDSGKSSTMRILRGVLEPSVEKIRHLPQSPRDLMIAAKHNHILAFDNLSGLRGKMSDALCTIATGIGQAGRKLYSDDEENIVRARRPIMLNGIDDISRRPDLLDRSIVLRLQPIKVRKTDRAIDKEFVEIWPFILGALFDAASAGLANFRDVPVESLPRMADFCQWLIGSEAGLPWSSGSFLRAYQENKGKAEATLLDTDGVASLLWRFIENREPDADGVYFEGTATKLLDALDTYDDLNLLPKRPHWLTNDLKRLNPAIKRQWGVEFIYGKRSKDRRVVCIRRVDDRANG